MWGIPGWGIYCDTMQTLYLKYRPQYIRDLDLTEVRNTLSKMLGAPNLPHAWLFSGPRGTGKTSSARILAKAVNCTHRSGFEPCNECDTCLSITGGAATDIVEVDAASNRGIDEIRELREKVKLAPMHTLFKVYIIDEVHMLTLEAANALLKTLEEPPEHALFVLCTTEPERLPDTVISRCTRVNFKKPTAQEGVNSLKRVVEGEKVAASDKALAEIVRAAKGSFRDGTKIVEQIILSHGKVDEEGTRQVLGMVEIAEPSQFLELLYASRGIQAIELIQKLTEQGINLRSWLERVAEELREEMLAIYRNKDDKTKLATTLKIIEEVEKSYERMKTSAIPQLPLEIMVMSLSGVPAVQHQVKEAHPPIPVVKVETVVTAQTVPAPTPEPVAVPDRAEAEDIAKESGKGKYSLQDLHAKWQDIMKAVRPKNHSVEALLRSTKPTAFDGERLTLEVFYKFHKDKLESEKCRVLVESAVGEVFGVGAIKLFLKLGQRQPKQQEVSAENVGEDILKAAEAIFKAEVV